MATKVLVGGKFQTRPGVYSTIKSGVKNPSIDQPYSNILIIDDGIGAGFGGGSGINGTLKNAGDAIYEFDNLQDFQAFVKGGELYALGTSLFKPSNRQPGVSKIYFAAAKTTAPASSTLTLTNGTITVQPKDEGVNANGVLTSGNLSNGLASKLIQVNIPPAPSTFVSTITQAQTSSLPEIKTAVAANINVGDLFTIVAAGVTIVKTATTTLASDLYAQFVAALNANGTVNAVLTASQTANGLVLTAIANNTAFTQSSSAAAGPAQFVYQLWHGTYKGLDSTNNVPWDNIAAAVAEPLLIIQSPAFTAIADLVAWMNSSFDFNSGFTLTASTASGNLTIGDLVTYPGYNLFAGGTDNYGVADFDAVLNNVNDLDFTHFLCMQYGSNATGVNNTKILTWLQDTSKYDRLMVVGGGYDRTEFVSVSAGATAYFNDDSVIVVHGGIKRTVRNAKGFNIYSQLHHAAVKLGRCAGLPPQVPVTLKSHSSINGFVHPLSDKEQEYAIAKGISYSYYDTKVKTIVSGLDVDSIQSNDFLINDNGTTYSWQIKRIEAALNKKIVINGQIRFYDPEGLGGNMNKISPAEVEVWASDQLLEEVADANKDGLIISFQEVVASIDQDNLRLGYKFKGNTEVSKLISTGTIIE